MRCLLWPAAVLLLALAVGGAPGAASVDSARQVRRGFERALSASLAWGILAPGAAAVLAPRCADGLDLAAAPPKGAPAHRRALPYVVRVDPAPCLPSPPRRQ